MEKYPFHSDYVDSYLNYFFLNSTRVGDDAYAFKNCVYLNPLSLTLTNCSDRRDRVNEYISNYKEQFDTIKSHATENCGKLVMEAFLLDKSLNSGKEKFSSDDKKNLYARYAEKEMELSECILKEKTIII